MFFRQRYVSIGFCCQKFPLINKWLGKENSIGITHKDGINFGNACVDFREDDNEDPEEFDEGDVVGIGIIYSNENASMGCFSTCNGELMGKNICKFNKCLKKLLIFINFINDLKFREG
jgi:hypothetical protein